MKIIHSGYDLIDKILKVDFGAEEYVPSIFNIVEEMDGHYLVFNTFSRKLIYIDDFEYQYLKSGVSKDLSLSIELIKMHFLVDSNLNEINRYFEFYNFNKNIRSRNKNIKTFKIYTTTHCNARCFYCFEEGMHKENMSLETADAVVDYICKNKIDGQIKLYWFGGEPLCNQKIIDYICERLCSKGVLFESTIITNGYLFNHELVKKSIKDWNLTFAQVTLDGYGEEHNRRKAYINSVEDPFERTLHNIHLLSEAGVKLIIRLNFDNDNLDNIKQLIQFLKKDFSNLKNITVNPVLLIDDCFMHKNEQKNLNKLYLNNALLELQEILHKENLLHYTPIAKNLKTNRCMADSPNSAIISTDGRLFTCQNCEDEMCYGNIYDGIINPNLLDSWRNPKGIRKKCNGCPFLPECTPFDKCPVENDFCILKNNYRIRKKMLAAIKHFSM